MPTYEYKCEKCGEIIEVFHGFRDPGPEVCPCGARGSLRRLISAGSGVIFKGSGFYETDYKRKPAAPEKSPSGKPESTKPTPAAAAETPSKESKPVKEKEKKDN